MSKGYDSAERESRERGAHANVCEGYACLERATLTVQGHHYCEAHRPAHSAIGEAERAPH